MHINYTLIGKRIRELRMIQGLSQESLAAFSNLSTVFICNIENAKKHPSLASLISIADALGVTMDDLLIGNQTNQPEDYRTDIDLLLYDCSGTEKRFLFDILKSTKNTLRQNDWEILPRPAKSSYYPRE